MGDKTSPGGQTRRHHTVPRFLLANFTDNAGFLFVHDLRRARKPFHVRPENAGHRRDYYRVEVPGEDPNVAEKALATGESAVAPIVQRVIAEQGLPTGAERETLLWFIAQLHLRVPKHRNEIERFATDLVKIQIEILLKKPSLFAAEVERQRAAGLDVSDMNREELLETFRSGKLAFNLNQTWAVGEMFRLTQTLAPAVVERNWVVLVADNDAPDFICSDSPVSLLPFRGSQFMRPVGWAMSDTFAFVALSLRVGLIGFLDRPGLQGRRSASKAFVAEMNRATLASAHRNIYSRLEDVIWLKPDGRYGHTSDIPRWGGEGE